MLIEQSLHSRELALNILGELAVLLLKDGAYVFVGNLSAVNIALEIVEVGVRPVFFLTGGLGVYDLVQQFFRAVGDVINLQLLRELLGVHVVVQFFGVLDQLVCDFLPLILREGGVLLTVILIGLGLPQILLDLVPAAPLADLAFLQVSLAGVQVLVKGGAVLFRYRFDTFVVNAGESVLGFSFFGLALCVELCELFGLGLQRLNLVFHIRGVLGGGGIA